ncbi:MAG: enoyl-CoA hydratase/isomerase family protein [Spirosomataceae bacterium]
MIHSFHDLPRFQYIEVAQAQENVCVIRLNRPEKRNAFTPLMISELAFVMRWVQENSSIWLVRLEANGPVFCAGMDLLVFENPSLDVENEAIPRVSMSLAAVMRLCHKPIVCLVEGNVYAGGFLLVGESTFVVCGEDVRFSLPEVKRGIFPFQVMDTLSWRMPMAKLLEISILGEDFSAKDALGMGLATFVVPKGNVAEKANELVEKLHKNAPFAIQKGIASARKMQELDKSERLDWLKAELESLKSTEDAREGILAFKEKRAPNWKNG